MIETLTIIAQGLQAQYRIGLITQSQLDAGNAQLVEKANQHGLTFNPSDVHHMDDSWDYEASSDEYDLSSW